MPKTSRMLRLSALLLLAFAFAGCKSPAEKAGEFYRKGMALYEQGGRKNLIAADTAFRDSITIKKTAPAIYGLALVAERRGKFQDMFSYLSQTLDIDPNQVPAQVRMGEMLLDAAQTGRAGEISDRLTGLVPDDPSVRVLKAGVMKAKGDHDAAVKLVQSVLDRNPALVDALVFMARDRFEAGQYADAVQFADRAGQAGTANPQLQLIKVQALDKLGQTDAAEKSLRDLVSRYPENRSFENGLVQFLVQHQRQGEAEAELRRMAAADPSDVEARLDVTRFVVAAKGAKAGIDDLNQAIGQAPASNELKFALASLYQGENDDASAEKVVRSIMAKAGDSRDGLKAKSILAGYLLAAGHKAQASALVEEILAKDTRNEQALVLKASMQLDQGQVDEAVNELRTVLQDVPDSSRALMLLGRAHESRGDLALADDFFSRAYQASHASPNFGMAYADFLMRHNQTPRAEGMLNDMLKAHPDDVSLLKRLAQAKSNQGDWAGAKAITERIRQAGA